MEELENAAAREPQVTERADEEPVRAAPPVDEVAVDPTETTEIDEAETSEPESTLPGREVEEDDEAERALEPEPSAEPATEPAAGIEPAADASAEPAAEPDAEIEPGANFVAEVVRPVPQAEADRELGPEAEADEAHAAEPGEEPDDGRRWYVVHCYSGYESKVRHNLEQRVETMGMKTKIFDVVIPTEEEIEVKDGKRRTVERHVFPGYILVQMLMDEDSWYVVRNTPGVTGFVGMGNEPTPLRPEEVQQIIRRMEAEAPRVKVTYKAGQRVRIIDGPFNDFIGTVDEIDMDRAKVRVMVSFFGRETPVELDFLQVEKA
jgi:transcriptional antiterminator NusG